MDGVRAAVRAPRLVVQLPVPEAPAHPQLPALPLAVAVVLVAVVVVLVAVAVVRRDSSAGARAAHEMSKRVHHSASAGESR